MESRIKRRAQIYGIAAVLLAVILGGVCYRLGVNPLEKEAPTASTAILNTFSSYDQLKSYLQENAGTQGPLPYEGSWGRFLLNAPKVGTTAETQDSGSEYSTTNIQVEGVDEADIVKTDGEYIYLISGNNVSILKAYPPEEAKVLSTITFNDTYPVGIFVEGDKLAVLVCEYVDSYEAYYYRRPYGDSKTSLRVYDLSDRTTPTLLRKFAISGSYFNSRMIDEYVYFVVSQPACITNDTVLLPQIYSKDGIEDISATDIQYFNTSDSYYMFTTIVAINTENVSKEPTNRTILLGGASCMYVSLDNIYITFPSSQNTLICRIHIEKDQIDPIAEGGVPGYVLNQFSMDEHEDHFRIATTTGHVSRSLEGATSKNQVYVLNMNLSIVGKIEDLASGEKIYSARFMGDRCYLVTFRKIDPLFVINLTEPTNPTVLGKLKIPGYSDYLHPYDENHIIGVGKHTVAADEGDFAWYQGVKISLFDVTNVNSPQQIANYTIGDRGTDSPILRDHKAFLFEKTKNLLVIPVQVAEIDETQYPDEVPDYASGTLIWQGAYVFNITMTNGFVLRGNITHLQMGQEIWNREYWVKRTLYIASEEYGDVLYTISENRIKMNSLEDLEFLGKIELP